MYLESNQCDFVQNSYKTASDGLNRKKKTSFRFLGPVRLPFVRLSIRPVKREKRKNDA